MRIILVLIIISVGSLFGSVVLNKRYEEMLPFSIFSIIISLYLFYILNLLKYGYYFILFSALILTIFSIYKFFRKKEIRKQAITNFLLQDY
jgi:Ca2+/Na+ antiporter